MQKSEIKEKMIRNFDKKLGQFQAVSTQREWAKLKPADLYLLLTSCTGTTKNLADSLLNKMAEKKWTIAATAHKGGIDVNAPLHITVRIQGQIAHHINCKELVGRGLYINGISQKRA